MTRLSDERIAEIKAVEESLRGDKVFGAGRFSWTRLNNSKKTKGIMRKIIGY